GTTGTSVTITGSALDSGCGPTSEGGAPRPPSVTFGGIAASVTSSSASSVVAVAPQLPAGFVDVRVTDCLNVQSPVVTADRFTYTGPVITSISPDNGGVGTMVTISGSALVTACGAGGPTVTFGTATASNTGGSFSPAQVTVPAPAQTLGRTVDVTVTDCQ